MAALLNTPLTRESACNMFSALSAQAQARDISLRQPPPEPSTCCGRGCNGCVWEAFFDAAIFWREDALLALQNHDLQTHENSL